MSAINGLKADRQRWDSRRRMGFALATILIALLLGGCALSIPTVSVPTGEPSLKNDLLTASELGPWLDDVEREVEEPLTRATGGMISEIRRQALLEDWRRTAVAMDLRATVTVKAFRFKSAAFGRTLLRPYGRADPRPPALPRGARATIGMVNEGYAERAVVFSKGPTFVRLEVTALAPDAPARSRALLARAARLQYGRLAVRRSIPGETIKTGLLKRHMAVLTIAAVAVLLVLTAVVTAVRDCAVRENFANLVKGRPQPPPHAVDVNHLARSTRRRLTRTGRRRILVTLALVAVVEVLPIGLVPAFTIVIGGLIVWNGAGAFVEQLVADRRRQRLFSGVDVLIGAVATAFSLAFVGAALLTAWLGIAVEVIGAPGVAPDGLARFRTTCVVFGVALLALSRVPMTIGRRVAMSRLSRRLVDERPPEVLVLRSFADEDLRLRVRELHRSGLDRLALRRWERFEELLALSLNEIGRVEAVGEPGRRLAPLGATRSYHPQADWKQGVSERIDSVSLVVVSVGRTPAVGWEVATIRRRGALDRAIFVIPPVDAQDRRARVRLLAELLEVDPTLLDHEQRGLQVLAVVVRNDGRPALITSGTRDDVSYDFALRSAAAVLARAIEVGNPAAADTAKRPPPPKHLVREPGSGRTRKPWYRRPRRVALAVVAALLIAEWGIHDRTTIDRFHRLADTSAMPRAMVAVEGRGAVIALQNVGRGGRLTEIDTRTGEDRTVADLEQTPTRGAARGRWAVLTSPSRGLVVGIDRLTGATWTIRLAGVPQSVAVGEHTAAVALTAANAIAVLRLRDGRLLHTRALDGAPYAIASWETREPLVSLALQNEVTTLNGRSFAVARPRQVFATAGGPWAVSAEVGTLVRLRGGAAETYARTDGQLIPIVSASRGHVALATDSDREIAVFDARTGRRIRTYRPPEAIQALALTDSGQLVVSLVGHRDVGVYDLDNADVGIP